MNGTVSTREPDGPMTLALNSFGVYNREFQISIQCNEVDPPQAISMYEHLFYLHTSILLYIVWK